MDSDSRQRPERQCSPGGRERSSQITAAPVIDEREPQHRERPARPARWPTARSAVENHFDPSCGPATAIPRAATTNQISMRMSANTLMNFIPQAARHRHWGGLPGTVRRYTTKWGNGAKEL